MLPTAHPNITKTIPIMRGGSLDVRWFFFSYKVVVGKTYLTISAALIFGSKNCLEVDHLRPNCDLDSGWRGKVSDTHQPAGERRCQKWGWWRWRGRQLASCLLVASMGQAGWPPQVGHRTCQTLCRWSRDCDDCRREETWGGRESTQ